MNSNRKFDAHTKILFAYLVLSISVSCYASLLDKMAKICCIRRTDIAIHNLGGSEETFIVYLAPPEQVQRNAHNAHIAPKYFDPRLSTVPKVCILNQKRPTLLNNANNGQLANIINPVMLKIVADSQNGVLQPSRYFQVHRGNVTPTIAPPANTKWKRETINNPLMPWLDYLVFDRQWLNEENG